MIALQSKIQITQSTLLYFPSIGHSFCCDMGQNDTIGKIELIPSSVLSENNTNYKNDIHKFSNSLSYQESTEIPIYTSRC